jgi:drug/metabolite transporter (DMT)-like permease
MAYEGELAAVATALCWAVGSLFFTLTGRKAGSGTVNRARLFLALVFLIPMHRLFVGEWLPVQAGGDRFLWLGLSGVIGYVAGDGMLFEAFVLIGPRLSMLLMTMVPIFGATLAWVFIGESLSSLEIIAILITMAGIAWVVGEKKNRASAISGRYSLGLLLGAGGALGQAVGLLLAKKGLEGGFSAVSGNLIRVGAAAVCLLIYTWTRGDFRFHIDRLADGRVRWQIAVASFLGPVLGVVLSLVAISKTEIGIASTLMSLSPLFLIPLSRMVFKERITVRAVVGTLVALCGSSLFFIIV